MSLLPAKEPWPDKECKGTTMNQPASAYFLEERHDPSESHTLSVLVQNEPGVLARVIGLFSGRGYNIESLTVSETESQKHLSRITIVTTGTPMVIEQIKHQLDRMVPIYRVVDMTLTGRSIERELAMVKVRGGGDHRVEARRHHGKFRVRDHRQLGQDQPVYRPDAPARPCRGVAHRRCRHRARARGDVTCWRATGTTRSGGGWGSIPPSPRPTTGMTTATSVPARR
jgi:acetolactate synthase-1/3 small subunit